MLVIGTGGLAKDIAGNITRQFIIEQKEFIFFNDTKEYEETLFLNHFEVIRSLDEAQNYFNTTDKRFISAIANPLMRMRLNTKFQKLGGLLESFIFTEVKYISNFVVIEKGSVIELNVIISSNTIIKEGAFINCSCIIGHDVTINQYCSLGPGVKILGGVEIGEFSYIGCNSIIMPGVKIGKKVRIGVGKIIDTDVPDNTKII
jgi:sugar O-acyltransferase (sialic acid O-acetyltransferase NeuD family)